MSAVDLTNPVFQDAQAAREYLESVRWPNGPVCPHCGEAEEIAALRGKAHRPGLYKCRSCRGQFSVTVGTVFERSKIALNKWLLASYLLCGSKKGFSAHQLHRMIGVTYKTAWFMAHRLREAMREGKAADMGGSNKVVEADETYVGGKAKNRAFKEPPKKEAVVALVERDGKVRSQHVPNVTSKTVREILVTQASRDSFLMTDESPVYRKVGREYQGHGSVNHSIDEYVRGGFYHTNTVENYFSILKRGINGTYQAVSKQHLKRYLGEFDFRYNFRNVDDWSRTAEALKGADGKRLFYSTAPAN
ncbi:IS1595 family transposase [Nisaea sp.]|uniref:IS1595 family transposase n=1 Tax=Nisaea sp. TaxID=2024842 RepID=UPI003B5178C1